MVAKSSNRGSKPGERRGGRAKGVPNKATADVKAMAQEYTGDAMKELARLSIKAESEAARVAAIKELFDRAFGKASQTLNANVNFTARAEAISAFREQLRGERS
jgi:hypothetical protein